MRSRADRWALWSLALLAVGCAASAYAASAWRAYVGESSTRAFAATAGAAGAALGDALQRDADLASTAETLIEMTPELTNAQLNAWFGTLRRSETFPGNYGMIYVEKVAAPRLPHFLRTVRRDPPFGIPVGAPGITRSASSASYCLTRFGVAELPSDVTALVPGVSTLLAATARIDFCRLALDPLLDEAAANAGTTVAPLASLLAQVPRRQSTPAAGSSALYSGGLTVTVDPVYRRGAARATAAERTRAIAGWTVSLYSLDQILAPLLAADRGSAIALAFRNPSGRVVTVDQVGALGAHDLTQRLAVDAAGTWEAVFSAPSMTSQASALLQSTAVLSLGFILSLMLFVLVRTLARARQRALQLADARSGELRHQALHDSLTLLPNRAHIFQRTGELLARARDVGSSVSILFVDLDRFKDVNDTFGHLVGDELLREVAWRFREALDGLATVGRLGGDEFVVLLERSGGGVEYRAAQRLLDVLHEPFLLGGARRLQVAISASIGIATGSSVSADDLLREADIALYEAKSLGRSRFVAFEPAMHDALQHRLGLEFDLASALADRELFIEYQPLVDLEGQGVRGAEALLRWRHPGRGVLPPGEFVPLLESSGSIVEVGRYVLVEACAQAARWHAAGHRLEVSVNVSAHQLDAAGLVDAVREALAVSGLDAAYLVLEITETAMMRDTDRSLTVLEALRGLGVQLAIDDFGTGYSSLSYLQRFAADSIKIDRSFVAAMLASGESAVLVQTLVRLGKALGLRTIAEGVEDGRQLALLQAEGCDLAQGFLFYRPLEPDGVLDLLAAPAAVVSGAAAAPALGPG